MGLSWLWCLLLRSYHGHGVSVMSCLVMLSQDGIGLERERWDSSLSLSSCFSQDAFSGYEPEALLDITTLLSTRSLLIFFFLYNILVTCHCLSLYPCHSPLFCVPLLILDPVPSSS